MNPEADPEPLERVPEGAVPARPRPWAAVRRHAGELLIVFLGVYAAFLLNRFDSYRRDEKRRAQIMEALEHETQGSVDELAEAISQNEPLVSEFERRLAAGEMPGLSVSMNSSTYSATDDATLLQAGGLDLLDVQTIELLRTVNVMERASMAERRNQFELSLAQLANVEPGDFYDPSTHRLKKRYEWWPYVQRRAILDAKERLVAAKALLNHIKAARGHH